MSIEAPTSISLTASNIAAPSVARASSITFSSRSEAFSRFASISEAKTQTSPEIKFNSNPAPVEVHEATGLNEFTGKDPLIEAIKPQFSLNILEQANLIVADTEARLDNPELILVEPVKQVQPIEPKPIETEQLAEVRKVLAGYIEVTPKVAPDLEIKTEQTLETLEQPVVQEIALPVIEKGAPELIMEEKKNPEIQIEPQTADEPVKVFKETESNKIVRQIDRETLKARIGRVAQKLGQLINKKKELGETRIEKDEVDIGPAETEDISEMVFQFNQRDILNRPQDGSFDELQRELRSMQGDIVSDGERAIFKEGERIAYRHLPGVVIFNDGIEEIDNKKEAEIFYGRILTQRLTQAPS